MSEIESLIDKATNKNNVSEDWSTIMEICDEANTSARETVNYLKKKIVDPNSNVALFSLTLADALVKNCNINVRREISSRGFLDLIVKQIQNRNVHEIVRQKMLYCIKQWNDTFGREPSLSYCNEIYNRLRSQNYTFEEPRSSSNRKDNEISNARLKQKEDEDLQLALALSLSAEESKNNKKSSSSSKKKYESPPSVTPPSQHSQQNKPLFKVKALYDFLGNYAEGELPLYAGDIINVYDTTYKDWWKGENRGMIGIFPNNYVERIQESSSSQPVNDEYETQVLREAQKIDEFMQILSRVDPKTENLSENDELQSLYNSICTLRPKLVKLVEFYSKKMEETSLLSSKFFQAQETYRSLCEQQQQQAQPLYAPIQQPIYPSPYGQPAHPQSQPSYLPAPSQPQSQPQPQPPAGYIMPMPSTQPPSQTTLPTTPPASGKLAYDPRLAPPTQPPTQPQVPQQQPQQPMYMPPYVSAPMDPSTAYAVAMPPPAASTIPPAMPNPYGNPQ